MSLHVYISNPERKKERTDADANDREIYVAGLSRFATKEDLETLFKTVRTGRHCACACVLSLPSQYGSVKEVRMALDDNGRPKGFAFVEFEDEVSVQDCAQASRLRQWQHDAVAALSANNHELKNRRMAVTLADTRVRARTR